MKRSRDPVARILQQGVPPGESTRYLAEGVCMSISTQAIFGIIAALGYLGPPIILVWGWARWLSRPKTWSIPAILSMISLVLAIASALLAASSIVFAQFHHFGYYDPLLLRIFRTGMLLSLGGIVFGISGVWRETSLRWHAPISGIATLAFWFMAASGE